MLASHPVILSLVVLGIAFLIITGAVALGTVILSGRTRDWEKENELQMKALKEIQERRKKKNREGPLKVIILVNDTTFAYNLRREIVQKLIQQGNDVIIVCQFLNFVPELRALGCQLIPIPVPRRRTNPFQDAALFFRFGRILKTENPDIVLTNNIKPNVYGGILCRLTKTPYITNVTGLGTPLVHSGWLQRITLRLYRFGISRASCVLFQNEENETFFRRFHLLQPSQRTRLLPGSGVNLEIRQPLPYPKEDTVHFLFIARMMREKGVDIYLDAAREISKHHTHVCFHICGVCDDPKYLEILREAQEAGTILYHGEQTDLVPFYRMAHCVVHPSYYPEGMSNVLLEAASHARPVIATDVAGCRETVEDHVTGFLIPPRDSGALTEAIEAFLELSWERRREMGFAGRRKVEREFDRNRVVQICLEEIERAVGETYKIDVRIKI